jgi:hypothetical protein
MAPLCSENGTVLTIRGVIITTNEHRDRGCAGLEPHSRGNTMSKIDELKAEIESLPSHEFAEIFRWLSEKDWERWDKEIEADSQAGRLDFLVREAREEKAKGTLIRPCGTGGT